MFRTYVSRSNFYDHITAKIIEPANEREIFIKPYSSNIQDTTVEVYTGANFYTKISGRKFSDTSTISIHTDSVFCNAHTINSITIRY